MARVERAARAALTSTRPRATPRIGAAAIRGDPCRRWVRSSFLVGFAATVVVVVLVVDVLGLEARVVVVVGAVVVVAVGGTVAVVDTTVVDVAVGEVCPDWSGQLNHGFWERSPCTRRW